MDQKLVASVSQIEIAVGRGDVAQGGRDRGSSCQRS